MQTEVFNEIVKARLDKTMATLCKKADEYARGDRLSNFRQISALMKTTNEKALMGLVAKHIVALSDFVNDLDNGLVQSYDRWDEKIGDIVAYMCLLDAIVQERELVSIKGAYKDELELR